LARGIFLECGQAVVGLNVWICGVQGDTNGDDVRKGRLELWVPVYCFLHREVVDLVSENDAARGVERARCQVVDEQLVGCINIKHGVVPPRKDTPVVRVVFP